MNQLTKKVDAAITEENANPLNDYAKERMQHIITVLQNNVLTHLISLEIFDDYYCFVLL